MYPFFICCTSVSATPLTIALSTSRLRQGGNVIDLQETDINARFEVIDKWYNGHVEKFDADVLARICFVLECTPGDIIRYTA